MNRTLASISTAVQGILRRMARGGGVDEAELKQYLEIVQRQVVRCHDVTRRLLGLARLPSQQHAVVE